MIDAANEHFARRAFSQFGEDGVLGWLFHGRRNGFYVDVGCHHPFRFSNTAAFYLNAGWRGLNIDVDERAIAAFQRYRPEDINILIGVAGAPGQMEVTIFAEGAINSFDEASAAHPAWAHIAREKKLVEVKPLGQILHENMPKDQPITFMNVDAEGMDYDVLASNDWATFRPEAVAVEVHDFDIANARGHRTFELMVGQGYRLISHVAVTSIYSR